MGTLLVFGVLECRRGAAAPLAGVLGEADPPLAGVLGSLAAPRLVGVLGEAPPLPTPDADFLRWQGRTQ